MLIFSWWEIRRQLEHHRGLLALYYILAIATAFYLIFDVLGNQRYLYIAPPMGVIRTKVKAKFNDDLSTSYCNSLTNNPNFNTNATKHFNVECIRTGALNIAHPSAEAGDNVLLFTRIQKKLQYRKKNSRNNVVKEGEVKKKNYIFQKISKSKADVIEQYFDDVEKFTLKVFANVGFSTRSRDFSYDLRQLHGSLYSTVERNHATIPHSYSPFSFMATYATWFSTLISKKLMNNSNIDKQVVSSTSKTTANKNKPKLLLELPPSLDSHEIAINKFLEACNVNNLEEESDAIQKKKGRKSFRDEGMVVVVKLHFDNTQHYTFFDWLFNDTPPPTYSFKVQRIPTAEYKLSEVTYFNNDNHNNNNNNNNKHTDTNNINNPHNFLSTSLDDFNYDDLDEENEEYRSIIRKHGIYFSFKLTGRFALFSLSNLMLHAVARLSLLRIGLDILRLVTRFIVGKQKRH